MHRKITALLLCLSFVMTAFCSCTPVESGRTFETEKVPSESSETGVATDTSDVDTQTEEPEVLRTPILKYDKYMLSSDAREFLTDREEELYRKTVDSIIEHSGVIEGFATREEYEKVKQVLLTEFVPWNCTLKTYLDMDEPFVYENGKAQFFFKGDRAYCDGVYAAFEDVMNEALSLIREDDGDWEKIAKLYVYVSENMEYGSPYKKHDVTHDDYNCIRYKIGGKPEFAHFLNMLARQAGFEAKEGRSIGEEGSAGMADHFWSLIKVEGKWYHFDACFQNIVHTDTEMYYFAMNTEDRYESISVVNITGERFESRMFERGSYTNKETELPWCDYSMSDKEKLYNSVIEEYRQDIKAPKA